MHAKPAWSTTQRLTIRRVLFRLHWIAGLAAGLVLAVVGITGALIGFEGELTGWLNPQYQIDAQGRHPLSADQWIENAQQGQTKSRVRSFAWSGDDQAVRVRLSGGRERGEVVAIDLYSGAILAPQRGESFFAVAEDLHRRLAAGPVGKQLVAASTALLLLMLMTGIYLRWPKRGRSWSTWFSPDMRLQGRGLIWNLHAVVGTWLLASYLLAALTGLWWSYDFYRDAVNAMAGVDSPMRRPPASVDAGTSVPTIAAAWFVFRRTVPEARRASLALPVDAASEVEIRYQDDASAHERAWNTIRIDAASGEIVGRQLHFELPRGRRFVSALFPLHSGSYFGMPGRVVTALASLAMPFFAVTGVWLWILRRRQMARWKSAENGIAAFTAAGEFP